MLNVFFLFNYKASCLIPAKRKSPLHGQHMWGKCSQQPVPTYPLRYLTWWIRTEPLPQCDSTCSVWRTFVPSLRKRTTTIQVYWKNTSLYLCRFIYIVCVVFVDVVVRIQKLPRLLVASSDGFLYIYNVDPQDGGECVLVQKHRCVYLSGMYRL